LENIHLHIEAIIFSSAQPVSIADLGECMMKITGSEIAENELQSALDSLAGKYKSEHYSFELVLTGGGYQFLSKPQYHETIAAFLNQKENKKLSAAALETLSIIAYRQPVSKSEIEQMRGVNSDYTVHKLLEKELISIVGKGDGPGRPVLYGVSPYFLDYFGINSTEELPQLKEIIPKDDNVIGEGE
jgi:segregation and condensation protein B